MSEAIPFDWIQYGFSSAVIFFGLFRYQFITTLLCLLTIGIFAAGAFLSILRLTTVPSIFGVVIYLFASLILGEGLRIFALLILIAGTAFSVLARLALGKGNFESCEDPTGKFGVGVKSYYTEKNSQHVLVFYPVEKKYW